MYLFTEENINVELAKQKLPGCRMLEKPRVALSEAMDPVLQMFIYVGVPIISVGMAICFYFWIKAWLKSRQMKIGQELVEDVVLKRLPMPTVEEVGEEVVDERELLKNAESGVVLSVEERVVEKYKQEEIHKIKKARNTAAGDKINFNLDDFHYRDHGKEIPDAVVSAFLTTGKFEATSDTTGDVAILQTYRRLEKLKDSIDPDMEGVDRLLDDKDRLKDLIRAGARVPKSQRRPVGVSGIMPEVDGSRELQQQVAAQHKQASALGGSTMPEFLKDYQREQFQKHPEPMKLGKRIEAAAARGPRNSNNGDDDDVLLLENGNANGSANGRQKSNRLLGMLTAYTTSNTKHGGDGDEVEVMV